MISFITKNWALKLVSLILAIGLWYYAVGEESIEVRRVIPLEINVKAPNMSILKSSVKNIWVTLSAPRNLLSDLTAKEIKAVHDIGSQVQAAGDYSFRLEAREIRLPSPQIRVVKIIPETVSVTLDEVINQKLKIKPIFSGEPAFGYKIQEDGIQIDPNAILLEGPKGQMEKIDFVETEMIDLLGRIRSFRRTVKVDLPSNVKALSEAVVDIFIPIKEEFGEKQFEGIPLRVLSLLSENFKVELNPSEVSFILKGSRIQLEKLKDDKMLAYVDIAGLEKGTHSIPVTLVLPEEVSLKEDVTVSVTLSSPAN